MLIYRFPLDRISLFREHEHESREQEHEVLNLMKLNIGITCVPRTKIPPCVILAYGIRYIMIKLNFLVRVKSRLLSTYILLSGGGIFVTRDIIDLSPLSFP